MGSNTTKPEISKKELERANSMWVSFMQATKWSIIFVAIILVFLLLVTY